MSNTEKKRGRQKIEMRKMTKESNLLVTFSKRRVGLFKKASEISTLCGAEVAIVVFSPGNKVYSFGHPSVETVIDRFLSRSSPSFSEDNLVDSHKNANIRTLNSQLDKVLDTFGAVKKQTEKLKQMNKNAKKDWWKSPIESLSVEQKYALKNGLQELQANIQRQGNKLLSEGTSTIVHPYLNLNNNPGTIDHFVGLENNNNQAMYGNNGQAFGYSGRPFHST